MTSYYQTVGLLTSAILGFVFATYLMHHEINTKHTLKDARSLASADWAGDLVPVNLGVRPFKISFNYFTISDLLVRLALGRKCTSNNRNHESCYSSDDLTGDVLDHWLNNYDFKSREAHLNRHPQFVQNVQGLDIHFYHVKPKAPKSKTSPWPLLILHGSSSSPAEFINLISNLTSPNSKLSFEVIVPSLPGFGFSGAPDREGLGPVGTAHMMKALMSLLGHERFVVQGNELGAEIAANMAVLYPESVLGVHSTMCRASPTGFWVPIKAALLGKLPWLLEDPEERELVSSLKRVVKVLYKDDGFQDTTTNVVTRTLEDSPAALAAHILQKYPLEGKKDLDLDVVVDNLMFYWVADKIESSLRVFKEFENDRKYKLDRIPVTVPTVCVGLSSYQNRMPVTLLRHRFQKLERYSSANGSSVLSSQSFSDFLADDITKSFASLNFSP